jgi:hypothetical protein
MKAMVKDKQGKIDYEEKCGLFVVVVVKKSSAF